jgi:hypothetical protein
VRGSTIGSCRSDAAEKSGVIIRATVTHRVDVACWIVQGVAVQIQTLRSSQVPVWDRGGINRPVGAHKSAHS